MNTKIGSLDKIVDAVDPDIVCLCETKKGGVLKEDQLSKYEVVDRNLRQGKEGFLIAVRKNSFITIKDITDTEMRNIFTAQIEYPLMTLRIIIAHAPQEKIKLEERTEFFDEVMVQVERGDTSGDTMLVLGDFNARLLQDENRKINAEVGSPNGKLLLEVVQKYRLQVCNYHENSCGKWTRIQETKDGEEKSIIDYVLVHAEMYKSLATFLVDEEKIFSPYREIGTQKTTYSDHCALIMSFELETGKVIRSNMKRRCWQFKDKEGLLRYQKESGYSMQVDFTGSSTEAYGKWVIEYEKLLGKCFELKTIKERKGPFTSKSLKSVREIIREISKKGKVQREVAKVYQGKLVEIESKQMAKTRAETLKTTISQLTFNEKFSPAGYWKLKTAVKKKERKSVDKSSYWPQCHSTK